MTNRRQVSPNPPAPAQELVERLVGEARRRLRAAANEKSASMWRRTYGEQVRCLGVDSSQTHHIGLELVRQMRTGGLALALEVADPLWRSGILEEGLVAAQVVGAMGRHIGGNDFERFEVWAGTLTNQVNADGLATNLVSKALAAKPSLVNKLKVWVESTHPERRRAAVMSFAPLVREGRFLTDAFSVVERVMADSEIQVQEGAGLMLREATRLQPERVMEFIRAWADKSPRRLLAKAAEKLSDSQRSEVLRH
jgi:3-methyladenine DNA glycosylase AlkD